MNRQPRLLLALVIGALGLRPMLIGIGPLLPRIEAEFGFAHAEAGLLTAIPLVGMGLFALGSPAAVRRLGSRRAVAAFLGLLCTAGLLRSAAPSGLVLLLLTVPIGLGIGVAGAVLPVFVKERFPRASAFATGVYTTAIQVGSAVSAAVAVPLAVVLAGWRGSLAAMSIAILVALVAWLALTGGERDERGSIPTTAARVDWRSPIGWWLALVFWLTALPFYGLTSWLAAAYVERGWTEVAAGSLVALLGFAGLPATLGVAWLADRVGSRRLYLVGSSLVFIAAGIGLILAPALAWLWAPLAGGSLGALFTLSMTLPLDVSNDASRTSSVVGTMLCAGYLLTAVTPVMLGAIRDLTGTFTASLWVTVAAGVAVIVVCLPLSGERLDRARVSPVTARRLRPSE